MNREVGVGCKDVLPQREVGRVEGGKGGKEGRNDGRGGREDAWEGGRVRIERG